MHHTQLGIAVKNIPRSDADIINQLALLGSATAHEAQGRIGNLDTSLRPIYPGSRIAGSAITVLLQPGDNWMLHVAIELCQPGDILVATPTSPNTDGYFGDLLATSAKAHGVRGLIIEGGTRDIADLHEMQFPVWSTAVSIKGTVKNTLGSVNVPVVCGGQSITPGDVVIADDDGICVVPRQNAAATLAAGQKRVENESTKRAQFAASKLGLDIYEMRERLNSAGFRYLDSLEELEADMDREKGK
ncbi:MAG: 4-carboxy-4-hydroxy-2-oxoadipate aldolase/oxaloacetate decarboxylase [Granulosicoccus sp.]|nr:4-carboxy-4-hydroxy-2-oxoadipate aldolase/oxaloacetate decarboxylase [Granulosicoccus sp.]